MAFLVHQSITIPFAAVQVSGITVNGGEPGKIKSKMV